MLRTEQILNAKFTPVSKGTYSAEEVDSFLKVVAESYEGLMGEKNELIKKISILADKIESYRNDEEAIKLSLLDAHRMAETINKNASIKSETLIGDAETRAQLIVDGANRQSAKAIDEAREQAKEIVDNARNAVASLTERAQKETDSAIEAAQKKAAEIVAEAEAEGKKIVGNSKELYEFYTAELEKIQAASAEFKAAMSALCNEQLGLLNNVPEINIPEIVEEAEEETVVEEAEAEIEIAEETVEADVEIAEVEEEISEDFVEETEVAEEEEQVVYVPEEPAAEADEVEVKEVEEETADDDDLFSFIDDISFENIASPESIPASLDDLIPSAPVAEEVPVENEAADEAEVDLDEDVFEGFKIDLDSIGLDDNGEDDSDDITSLFDSMFDE